VDKRESSIERLLHRLEGHIEEERERIRVREEEVQAYRGELWAEAAEREKLLVRVVSEEETSERSLEEICKEHRMQGAPGCVCRTFRRSRKSAGEVR